MVPAGPPSSYDAVPYPGRAFPQTHPDRLATIATLRGLRPPAPAACRVLELGCGDGGNLIPMALGLPGAAFVGIDTAPATVARARRTAERLELANVAFELADITDHAPATGGFDYVIAHGVYSWVAPRVRDALLALCRRALRSDGVAFVSYNALPGARMRQALWDMLGFHTAGIREPEERLAAARSLLALLVAGWPARQAFGAALRPEAERLLAGPDAGLFHDDLADVNDPVLFRTFADQASGHGLAYLGEAEVSELQVDGMPDPATDALAGVEDPLDREQLLDFLKGRAFRQTLLCRDDAARGPTAAVDVVPGLAVSSRLKPAGGPAREGAVRFAAPTGATMETDHPAIVTALERAGRAWPVAVPVRGLIPAEAEARTAVCEALLRAYAAGLVHLHVEPPPLVAQPGSHPVASPLARLQAETGTEVTSLRHTTVHIDDEAGRRLLTLLNGTRDRAALAAGLRAELGQVGPADAAAALDRGLGLLAELGLLVG